MGLFDKFVSADVKQRSSSIKINPYELPDVAAHTIAKICSFKKTEEVAAGELKKFVEKNEYEFINFLSEKRKDFAELDFFQMLSDNLDAIELELNSHENTTATQVVVAGGFSAGKSSFLNTISGSGDLLPTGINPVSMVSTYLYFSEKNEEIKVSGINQDKAPVLLNQDVLQSIKHADDQNNKGDSAVTLASVLNKLLVELPTKSKELDGICFIDTPGYNNDSQKNADNGIADKEMATSSFKDGNVLFWIIDSDAGTVNQKDEMMIQQFVDDHEGNCKLVIIFNKADKKRSDIANIVDKAYEALSKKSYAKDIIDVLGFTCTEGKILYSKNGITEISQLLSKVKASGNGYSSVDRLKNDIYQMFENEIQNQKDWIEIFGNELKETNNTKTDNREYISEYKADNKATIESLEDIVLVSYDKVMKAADKYCDMGNNAIGGWIDFYNQCRDWDNTDHDVWDNTFTPILDRWCDGINNQAKKIREYNYSYYKKEYRKDIIDTLKNKLQRLEEEFDKYLNRNDGDIDRNKKNIDEAKENISKLESYLSEFRCALEKDIRESINAKNKKALPDATYKMPLNLDVFNAIQNDDFSTFRLCFATKDGVKLTNYNAEGYSPLTYAVKQGNIEMVKFFTNHLADTSALDNRGMNALHTAAQNHNQAICKLLLSENASLMSSLTKDGKTAEQLAKETSFIF